MTPKEIKKLTKKTLNVGGWFDVESALFIGSINQLQKDKNIVGDIYEIGVHFGKSAIFFNHLLKGSENLNVCDIFNNQHLNTSNSGFGNKDFFLQNMKTFGKKEVLILSECLSSSLTPEAIGKNYRMFHIDGGHTKEEALYDLHLATQCLHEKGIIIVDDPFRHDWPGVTEAIIEFLQNNSNFSAFAVGFNKLLIAKKEASQEYLTYLQNSVTREFYDLTYPYSFKRIKFVNRQMGCFFHLPQVNPKSLKYIVYKRIKKLQKRISIKADKK